MLMVHRVITKKLVDSNQKKMDAEMSSQANGRLGSNQSTNPYPEGISSTGSFRVGYGT